MAKFKKDWTPSKQGEGGGKPPIFKNEQEFRQALLEYLKFCEEKRKMVNIAGFCAKNDFGRDRYYEYRNTYPNTSKAFESSLEDAWVDRLAGASATGAIFYLKNAFREHYKDRTEQDITSGGRPFTILSGATKKNGNNK